MSEQIFPYFDSVYEVDLFLASDGKLEEMTNILDRQTANLDQFKQQLRQLRIMIQGSKTRPSICLGTPIPSVSTEPIIERRESQSETSL